VLLAAVLAATALAHLPRTEASANANAAPVIGVLAQPLDVALPADEGRQYIVSSYVQWIQSAGARAALVWYNSTKEQLEEDVAQLSGLVLPGGGSGIHNTAYGTATFVLLDIVSRRTDFPVWGTCQGFQQLVQYASGHMLPSVLHLTGDPTEDNGLPVAFKPQRSPSRLLTALTARANATLTTQPVTLNLHHYSVLLNETKIHPTIAKNLNVLATSTVLGVEFATLLEYTSLPFYGSQFHPEKNAFEWSQPWEQSPKVQPRVVHGGDAVTTMTTLADFFVAQARLCSNVWTGGTKTLRLSYTYSLVPTVATSKGWEQCYVF